MAIPHRPAWAIVACLCATSPWAAAASDQGRLSCQFHDAVAGDTLIGLAQQYLADIRDWRALARVNQVRDPRRIPIGQRLCLPLDLLKPLPQPGRVLDVSGEVARHPPGVGLMSSRPVVKGDAVPPGTRLLTGPHGYVSVQLPDGSVLRVQSETDVRLKLSQSSRSTGAFSTLWEVLRGRVESLVTPVTDGQPRHQIQTPQATLGVRGTTFRVATDGTQTWGETLTGRVAVQSARAQALLQAGQGTVVPGHNQAPLPPVALPAAPDIGHLPAMFERPVVKFDLADQTTARRWRVQVAQDEQFYGVRAEVLSDLPLVKVSGLPDGHYFLRARAIDARGLEGPDAIHAFRLKARPEPPIPLAPANHTKIRARSVKLSWAAHPDALYYRLQLAHDAHFSQMASELPKVQDTQVTLDLPAGDYHWRVASTAERQDHGPWGDAQLLRMREPPAQAPAPTVTPSELSFELPAEPGQRFEFLMARDPGFTQVIENIRSGSNHIVVMRPPEGGKLFVRYRAIDEDGFVGPYATVQTVTLPACVRDADHQCVRSGIHFLTTQP